MRRRYRPGEKKQEPSREKERGERGESGEGALFFILVSSNNLYTLPTARVPVRVFHEEAPAKQSDLQQTRGGRCLGGGRPQISTMRDPLRSIGSTSPALPRQAHAFV